MDNYTEFLLERIFEIREDYKNGQLGSKDYYENVVGELVSCLSQYTVINVDKGYIGCLDMNITSFPKKTAM